MNKPEICDDQLDNNAKNGIDCADPECYDSAYCTQDCVAGVYDERMDYFQNWRLDDTDIGLFQTYVNNNPGATACYQSRGANKVCDLNTDGKVDQADVDYVSNVCNGIPNLN
jgi:hypothetical protein